jgi:hypothetical protein
LHERIGKHRGSGRAIAGDIVRLLGDLADDLGAHILERTFQFDLGGDGDAVARNDGRADRPVHHSIHAARTERSGDRTGELVDAAGKGVAGSVVMKHHLGHLGRFLGSFLGRRAPGLA